MGCDQLPYLCFRERYLLVLLLALTMLLHTPSWKSSQFKQSASAAET